MRDGLRLKFDHADFPEGGIDLSYRKIINHFVISESLEQRSKVVLLDQKSRLDILVHCHVGEIYRAHKDPGLETLIKVIDLCVQRSVEVANQS